MVLIITNFYLLCMKGRGRARRREILRKGDLVGAIASCLSEDQAYF